MLKMFVCALLRRALAVTVLCHAVLVFGPSPASAAEFTVTNLNDGGPGSLREAMVLAATNGGASVITINATGTISLASSLPDIGNNLAIVGQGPGALAIAGSGEGRLVHVLGPGVEVSFSGLTLSGGYTGTSGGAVLLEQGDAATTLSFTNCVLEGNEAAGGNGGAISTTGPSTGGTLNLVDCTLSSNLAAANGGAIDSPGATINLFRCTLSDNFAWGSGGGVSLGTGLATIENCTISGNETPNDGGGINSNFGAAYDIRCSTISSNIAGATGGGLRTVSFQATYLRNTIIAGNRATNSAPDVSGSIDSLGHNVIGNSSGGSGFLASDLLDMDPLLGPLQDNGGPTLTHALVPGSPALDAGDNSSVPATDQRGFPRVTGTNIDIGAFERTPLSPAIVCPPDKFATNDVGQCSAIVVFTPTASGIPTPTVSCTPASGSAFPVGTNSVSCSASNSAGTDMCSFLVTVIDTEAPSVSCPSNIVASADFGQCTKSNVTFAAIPTDNCPGVSVVCNPASGSTFSKGPTAVICMATDTSGNSNTCTFTITIIDTQPPSISCPSNVVASTDFGQCTKSNVTFAATPSDNCPGVTGVCTPASGATFAKGPTTVTCVATDTSGNTNTCSFTVTIIDTQPPAINCPSNIVASTDPGQCTKSNVTFVAIPTDNCPGATVVCTPASGATFAKGPTTVTCMATDTSGSSNACTFTVTILDTQPPSISCPSNIVASTDLGQCTKSNVTFAATSADNCPGVTPAGILIASNAVWKYLDNGSNQGNPWTSPAFDDSAWASGPAILGYNGGAESTSVSYGPNAAAKYITTYFRRHFTVSDPSLITALTVSLLRDDGGVVYLNGQEVFRDNMPAGTVTYLTFAATSVTGTNRTSFHDSPPIDPGGLVPGDNVVAVEIHQRSPSSASMDFDLQLLSALMTTVCTPASGSTFSKGVTPVNCVATDASGNTNACSFTVTILDNQPPSISCPSNIVASTDGGQCTRSNVTFTPIPTDNCPGVTVVCTPASGATFSKGTTSVGCVATDTSGNTNTCAFTVTILDTQPPSLACPSNIVASTDGGQCTKSNVTFVAIPADNCPGATVVCTPASGSTFVKGPTTVTCVATDTSGNTNTCTFTVTIIDTQLPTISCPSNIVASTDGGQCTKSNVTFAPLPTDNCPGVTAVCTPASGSTFNKGTNSVKCVATDTSGRTNTCTFTVTIKDTELPSITCPTNIVASTDGGQCTKSNVTFVAIPADNCPGATVVCTPASGSTFIKGTTGVGCVATDTSGNTNACTFTVTIIDTQPPSISCPSNIVASTDFGQCTKSNVLYTASAADNCPGATVVCAPASGATFVKGPTTVNCLATDTSGNSNTCTFTVTILDTQPPSITCPSNIVASTDLGQCTKSNLTFAAIPTDNCPGVIVACSPVSGSTFAKGTTTVTCVATDTSGNTNTCTFTVTILDTQPPSISCPSNIVASTDLGQCTRSNVTFAAIPTDNCPGVIVACSPVSGSAFAKGPTTLICVATDTSGNTNACSFTVTINDTEAPSLTCPANITVECAGPPGTVVPFTPIFADNCPGVSAVCAPPSGSTFSLGVSTVQCIATDAVGNTTPCSFTVKVQDTTRPIISCPANIIAAEEPHDLGSAVVTFPVPGATDICDSSVAVACLPVPGSHFAVGYTTVTCTATDDSGNTNACTFTVRVIAYRLRVTVTDDAGPGTFRQALLDANDAPGENRIEFHIPGFGPEIIGVLSALPWVTSPVIIDGWTQPGFVGMPLIELDGSLSGGADGLIITAGSSTVRGLALHGFANGICLATNGENVIQGNYIGPDATGTTAPGNSGDGLCISSPRNVIGGTSPTLGNVISGNAGHGIHFDTLSAVNNFVQDNLIGTDKSGVLPLGNGRNGVFFSNGPSFNSIGSATDGTGNVIAFNGRSGVSLDASTGARNAILGNSIFSNAILGIDLGADGVTLNDAVDADGGPNRLQNFPTLSDARSVDGVITIVGMIATTPNTSYRLEFFLNDATNSLGFGEGRIFLGSTTVATRSDGTQDFSASVPGSATFLQFITATAIDPFGNSSEFSAPVRVRTLPVLQVQPANTNTPPGTPVTLCASASGTPPFTWQWRLNGANILGATNACYTILNPQTADGGAYTVVVENDLGTLTTVPATLHLPVPMLNAGDNFTNRVRLDGDSGTVSGSNRSATHEAGEPNHAGKPGGKSVWYTWKADETGIVTIGTKGSTFDTLLAVYTGSKITGLALVASDEDRGGFYTSGLRFNAIEDTKYQIAVDGYYGAEGDFDFFWTEEETSHLLPVIATQPKSQTVAPGTNVTFSAHGVRVCSEGILDCNDASHYEDGDLPKISYQWFFNGIPIPGADDDQLKLRNVQASSVGDYTVQVTAKDNKYTRTVESDAASLQINLTGSSVQNVQSFDKMQDAVHSDALVLGTASPVTVIANDGTGFAAAATTVVRGYTGTQIFNTTSNASQGETFCGVAGGASRWINLVAERTGRLIVTTDGSSYETLVAVFTSSPTNPAVPTFLGCDRGHGSNSLTSKLTVNVQAGITNFVGVDGVAGASGILQLNFSLCPDAAMVPLGVTQAGARHFQVSARPGLPLTIQISPDLRQWSTLLTTNAPTDVFEFVDASVPAGGRRFYRAQICP